MNRILLIIVVLLLPIAVFTDNKEADSSFVFADTLENKLDINQNLEDNSQVDNIEDDNNTSHNIEVLISSQKDKSNAYKIELEEYIIGVVAGEMPASFEMEALKAQAVASRSFALNRINSIPNYVLSTTINDQVYLTVEQMKTKWGNDFQYYYERVKRAVEDTKGQVVTYDGSIITAYYFAISNGYTESSVPVFNETREYLVSVPSSWDKNYQSYQSVRTMSKASFFDRLGITAVNLELGTINRSDTHYVRSIIINGKSFTGLEIFQKLSLKSTDFEIKEEGDNILITTYGFGHGVGMSQYGAQGMAREGYQYQDILKHYYKNTEITNI